MSGGTKRLKENRLSGSESLLLSDVGMSMVAVSMSFQVAAMQHSNNTMWQQHNNKFKM